MVRKKGRKEIKCKPQNERWAKKGLSQQLIWIFASRLFSNAKVRKKELEKDLKYIS